MKLNILITVCLLFITFTSLAQLETPHLPQVSLPRIPSIFDAPTPPAAPIDGGLSLLIAAGAGYGMKKIKEKRRKENDNKI